MFEILFRITDAINDTITSEELDDIIYNRGGDISGYFAINVNGYHHGQYHNYPLQPGEHGFEQLTNWFLSLFYAYQELNRSGYVLISELNSCGWIELRKIHDSVQINIIYAEKPNGTTTVRLTPLEEYEYGSWYIQYAKDGKIHDESVDRRGESVKLSRFRSELLRKAAQYLEELYEINPKLLNNKRIAELEALATPTMRGVNVK